MQILVAELYSVYQHLVVGDEHSIRIVVATVEPLMKITAYCVYANDIIRKIEVLVYLFAFLVSCKEKISYSDMRVSRSEELLIIFKSLGVYLSVSKQYWLFRIVVLIYTAVRNS